MNHYKAEILCEKIVEFIIGCDITVLKNMNTTKLAEMFSVNRSYLSKTFKFCRNEGIGQYLKRMKIIKSAALIVGNNHITVKQTASQSGFKSVDHFSKSFKEFFCTTPSKFKKYFFMPLQGE